MTAMTYTQVTETPQSALTRAPSGLLLQRCACGGTPGVDGECAGCRAQRLGLPRQLQALAGLSSSSAADRHQAAGALHRQPVSGSSKPLIPSIHLLPLQAKLTVNEPGDVYEREADRVADRVMRMPDPVQVRRSPHSGAEPSISRTLASTHVQRCGATPCNCSPEERAAHMGAEALQRAAGTADAAPLGHVAPPIVHDVLRSPGQSLDAAARAFMEPRFGHDFSHVRVHTNARAADSARAVNALAYTVGRDVVFGPRQYAPRTSAGLQLIAHELTHNVQQTSAMASVPEKIQALHPNGGRGHEANAAANGILEGQSSSPILSQSLSLARQDDGGVDSSVADSDTSGPSDASLPGGVSDSSTAPDAGTSNDGGGAMPSPGPTSPGPASPVQVCSRDLQVAPVGHHAYIDAPPFRYAILGPTCPQHWYDKDWTVTSGQKWDNSKDPCGKTPTCVDCSPAPGVTDVQRCLRDAFTTYADPSLYQFLGPNSNTFAGTLARTCCAGMVPKPAALGWCPGWDHAPAPYRGGVPCPLGGPSC